MVTAFNPCGMALLPAYLAYILVRDPLPPSQQWREGLLSGISVTLGFIGLFGLAGWGAHALGSALFRISPVISLILATALAVLAAGFWTGRITTVGGLLVAPRPYSMDRPGHPLRLTLFLYGMAYGLSSLGCSLPVFLAVMSASLLQPTTTVGLFLAYALGMGLVVAGLTALTLTARHHAERLIHGLLPYLHQLTGSVLAIASAYLVWYWLWGPHPPIG